MSYHPVRQWVLTCDFCGTEQNVTTETEYFVRPADWTLVKRLFGMYDYPRAYDACPNCTALEDQGMLGDVGSEIPAGQPA